MKKEQLRTLLILLLLVTLFKGVVWSALVPIWHAPDEQAHFAQVQYYAEMKQGIRNENDLSEELLKSEKLLGTYRDERGNNKFTYHPEYKIEYSNTTLGIFESEINNIPISERKIFVAKEAARYPPLFYIISTIGYLTTYPYNLFIRLVFARFISVVFAVATVWASFLLARAVFPKKHLLCISIAALVSFQPMFSFLSSGVNNDNLLNLLTTLLLWVMVEAIRYGLTVKKSLAMGTILGLGIITKQLMYPFIPLPFFVIIFESIIKKKDLNTLFKQLTPFVLTALLFGGIFIAEKFINSGRLPFWPVVTQESPRFTYTFIQYLSDKIPLLYRETLPWYWGVFKWLGVVLPLSILRLIKIAMVFSFFGLIKYFISGLRLRKRKIEDYQLLFLLFSSIWFIFVLLFWDYSLIRSIGFSHGLQGRNFFPNLAAHMTLLAFGFWSISRKYRNTILKISVLAMIILNFLAMKRILEIYYTTASLTTLVIQLSQYKPWFFKGVGFVLWFVIYISLLSQFIGKLMAIKERKK